MIEGPILLHQDHNVLDRIQGIAPRRLLRQQLSHVRGHE
jgi:hypothetical protein